MKEVPCKAHNKPNKSRTKRTPFMCRLCGWYRQPTQVERIVYGISKRKKRKDNYDESD